MNSVIEGLINSLIVRDWTYPENIHQIFTDHLFTSALYYSKDSCIIYNISREMIGYINTHGKLIYI